MGKSVIYRKCALILALALIVFFSTPSRAKIIIKMGGLAPEGSVFMDEAHEFEKAVERETGGEVDVKWYAGGVLGDEKDMIRLMRIGQLHGAGITGMGAGYIDMSLRVLEIPFLFQSYDEIDTFLKKVLPLLKKRSEKRGFVILEPTEAGFVYFLSTGREFKRLSDLSSCKMWVWGDDPMAVSLASKIPGISPIPLPMSDLLLALKTGIVNCLYFTPMAVIAFQLHTALKTMTDFPITYGSGWMVMSKKFLHSLPEKVREIVLKEAHKYFSRMRTEVRGANIDAKQSLLKYGIKIIKPSPELEREMKHLRKNIVLEFVQKFMPDEIKEFLKREKPELFQNY